MVQAAARPRRRQSTSESAAASRSSARRSRRPISPLALGTPAIQPKLTVNQPGDRYEREADAVANAVTNTADSSPKPNVSQANLQQTIKEEPVQRLTEEDQDVLQRAEAVEEPIQRTEETEPEPLQRAAAKEEPIQQLEEGDQDALQRVEEAEEPIQRLEQTSTIQRQGKGQPQVSARTAATIQHPGSGSPLPTATRDRIEPHVGANLSGVRVHNDAKANQAASNLNARAFTHGNHIFLNRSESSQNLGLMAHEATHTVQQQGGLQRQIIQRNGDTATGSTGPQTDTAVSQTQQLDLGSNPPKLYINRLELPTFKAEVTHRQQKFQAKKDAGQLRRPKGFTREDAEGETQGQTQVWMAQSTEIESKINQHINQPPRPEPYLIQPKQPDNRRNFSIGTPAALAEDLKRPTWNRQGQTNYFDVDHIVELQVGGANSLSNMELLDRSANRSSGSSIAARIRQAIQTAISENSAESTDDESTRPVLPPDHRTLQRVKDNYDVIFRDCSGTFGEATAPYWSPDEITGATHIDFQNHINIFDPIAPERGAPFAPWPSGVDPTEFVGSPSRLVVYPHLGGGRPKYFDWQPDPALGNIREFPDNEWIRGFELEAVRFIPDASAEQIGALRGKLFASNPQLDFHGINTEIEVRRMPGLPYTGYIYLAHLKRQISSIFGGEVGVRGASPIRVVESDLDVQKGIVVRGKVLPTIPLIQNADIDIVLEGNDLRLEKAFQAGEFNFPGPIQVRDSTLILSIGTNTGLGIDGQVQFSIERLGEGTLGAMASSGTGQGGSFAVEGTFNFDPSLFDPPSSITVRYRDNQFSGEGQLTISSSKVPGIESATIQASFTEDRFEASGDAQLSVPGVQRGTMRVSYSETEGFAIGGAFELANNIPGIRSGSIEAEVRKQEDLWHLSAEGTAVPAIPGVDTQLTIAYADGAITIEGRAAYERGLLSGTILLGATNRPVDDPNGEPGERFHAYGGGTVTVRIAPWLEGTIGLELLPEGEMEVSGSIGLPDSLDIFPEKRLDKNIFSVDLDIPIVGFAVAGQRVGIFATVGGGLDASAGIGPGQIRELGLTVTYNPDHEDQTHVEGGAELYIPAHAGLRLFIRGSLGAGIPIVSASLGLEVGGQLGLEGAVVAGVQVDWTPTQGLVLDASGEIFVQPKFRFDLTGFALVEADLFLTTIELYEQRWELAAFEFGPDLRFGIRFPVHYAEDEPFDIALSDVEFIVPDVDTGELLEGLVDRVV